MLKITEISRNDYSITLKLEGRVVEDWIAEVRKACEEALLQANRLSLDMSDVSFVGRRAVALFDELQNRQVALINCSPFLSQQLKQGDFYADDRIN